MFRSYTTRGIDETSSKLGDPDGFPSYPKTPSRRQIPTFPRA
ncbi:hypothetical protein CKA32_002030 [Geitlerinema sp. FC II]|nr:hypothetical protein CKA32_002030 [Geitlerinema sp. FC II]